MARNSTVTEATTRLHANNNSDNTQHFAVAIEAADLPSHQLWLQCLEQMRQAQYKMLNQCMGETLHAGRQFVAGKTPADWLTVQKDLLKNSLAHTLDAQADVMASWAKLQQAICKDISTKAMTATTAATPAAADDAVAQNGTAAMAPWLDGSLAAWRKMSNEWIGALAPKAEATSAQQDKA